MSLQVPPGYFGLTLTRPPVAEPLTLAQAKAHLRIAADQTDFDDTVLDLIATARNVIEENYGLPLMPQGVSLVLSQFPRADRIRIPIWPVQSVDALTYVGADQAQHTMSLGAVDGPTVPDVLFDLDRKPSELVLPWAHIWPTTILQTAGAIRIDLTVGFLRGDSPETLPMPSVVTHAMKLLIGHYFENPEAVTVIGRPSEPLVLGIDNLMSNIRLHA